MPDKSEPSHHDILPLLRIGLEDDANVPDADAEKTVLTAGPVAARAREPAIAEAPGTVLGRYRLIEQLGEGGFGTVWRAEQREPIQREVALKVIKPGMDSREIIARFAAERQALALMDHPHIAAVLDAGTTENGRPYFVMELVKGAPITDYCDEKKLTIRERLELFIPICQAVQHAHQKAILHRDLKPSNILVEEVDGRPAPKIIDFGIAKALGADAPLEFAASVMQTREGFLVGTPAYMSPEQASGGAVDVDIRSDIYSLGVVLYELLSGSPPLSGDTLRQAGMEEVLRMIREEEPLRLEQRLKTLGPQSTTVAAQRGTEVNRLTSLVRGELDWIVLKALEKDRERRYASASALAEDIGHHLRDEPVNAGPPSQLYRFRKLVRRNKAAFAAAAMVVLSLITGLGLTLWQMLRATRAEHLAVKHLGEAQAARGTAEEIINDMLFDMRDRLEPIGKLDLLDHVSRTAENYFQRLPPELHTRAARKNESVMWQTRVQVLMGQGKLPEARAAADQMIELAKRLVAETPGDAEMQDNLGACYLFLAEVLDGQDQHDAELDARHQRRAIYERLTAAEPANTRWQLNLARSMRLVGWTLHVRGQDHSVEALAEMREAAEILDGLLAKAPEDRAVLEFASALYTATGSVLRMPRTRDVKGALESDRKALEYTEKRARLDPADATLQRSLVIAHEKVAWDLRNIGDHAGMMEHRNKQLAIVERLTQHDPTNMDWQDLLAAAHWNMSDALNVTGRKDEALQSLQKSLEIRERLVLHDPANSDWRGNYWNMEQLVGAAMRSKGDLAGALAVYRKALQTTAKFAENDVGWKADVAACHDQIGDVLKAQGNLTGALDSCRTALEMRESLARGHPDDAWRLRGVANSHQKIGDVLQSLRDFDGSMKSYREGLRVMEELARKDTGDSGRFLALASCHQNMGDLLHSQGDQAGATEVFRAAMRVVKEAVLESGTDNDERTIANRVLELVGFQLDLASKLPEAAASPALEDMRVRRSKAHALAESVMDDLGGAEFLGGDGDRLAKSWWTLARIELASGRRQELVAACDRMVEVRERQRIPDALASALRDTAGLLRKADDTAGALARFTRAAKLWDDETARNPSAQAFGNAGQGWSALSDFQETLGDKPAAIATLRSAIKARQRALELMPGSGSFQRDLIGSRLKLARLLLDANDEPAALAEAKLAFTALDAWIPKEPNAEHLNSLATDACSKLWDALRSRKSPEGLHAMRQILALRHRMESIRSWPENLDTTSVSAHITLGSYLYDLKDEAGSAAAFAAAVEAAEKSGRPVILAYCHDRLRGFYHTKGKLDDAERHARLAWEIAQKTDLGWRGVQVTTGYVTSLWMKRKFAEAEMVALPAWELAQSKTWPGEPLRLRVGLAGNLREIYRQWDAAAPEPTRAAAALRWAQMEFVVSPPLESRLDDVNFSAGLYDREWRMAEWITEGKAEEFRQERRRILDAAKGRANPAAAATAARLALLLPANGAELEQASALAALAFRGAPSSIPGSEWHSIAQGLALHRTGKPQEALAVLQPALEQTKTLDVLVHLRLVAALAHQASGNADQAKSLLDQITADKAAQTFLQSPANRTAASARVLLAEVRRVAGVDGG